MGNREDRVVEHKEVFSVVGNRMIRRKVPLPMTEKQEEVLEELSKEIVIMNLIIKAPPYEIQRLFLQVTSQDDV